MNKTELKKLVKKDLSKVFQELDKLIDSQNVKINDFIILEGRYNRLEGDRRKGLLSNEEYYKEQNILMWSCLGLIDELSDVTIENSAENKHFTSQITHKAIPRLEVELVARGKWKSPKALSRKTEVDKNGAIWIGNAIYINEIGWKYKIIIRNNSSYPAFYPSLEFENGKFNSQLEQLNKNKAIQPFEEVVLNAKHAIRLEAKGSEAIDYMKSRYLPDELKELSILIKYQNEKGRELINRFKIIDGNGYNEIL